MHVTTVKQLIAKQITDNEKIILSGINPNYSVDDVDKGTFVLKEFQDHLALNTAIKIQGVHSGCTHSCSFEN